MDDKILVNLVIHTISIHYQMLAATQAKTIQNFKTLAIIMLQLVKVSKQAVLKIIYFTSIIKNYLQTKSLPTKKKIQKFTLHLLSFNRREAAKKVYNKNIQLKCEKRKEIINVMFRKIISVIWQIQFFLFTISLFFFS